MLKIHDYIFNENEITHIVQMSNGNLDTDYLVVYGKDKDEHKFIPINATFEDIEWNYEDKQIRKCLNSIDREEELEEDLEVEKSTSSNLAQRILKAIEYIENMPYAEIPDDDYENNHKMVEWNDSDLLKILKGVENESN